MKKLLFLIFFIVFFALGIIMIPHSLAQDASCDNLTSPGGICYSNGIFGQQCQDKISTCTAADQEAANEMATALAPNVAKLNALNAQIQGIKNTVADIEQNLAIKKQQIDTGYANLSKQKEILDATVRDYYINSYYNSPLVIFLSSSTASQFTQILGYQKAQEDQDKAIITNIALTIKDLQNQKTQLETKENQLTVLKSNLDQQSAQLNTLVSGALAYQATLSNQLSQLNAIQQQVLAAKLSGLNIPLFAYSTQSGCSSDINPYKDPGFSGTKFGFFTYGVPNRVGLNQYGAWGRAKAGQDYNQILQAYYNYDSISNADQNTQITVTGYGTYSLEDYVRRVYEVPDSWTDNNLAALKAQAIAVRSYVLAYTNNGANPICATQQCQVFQPNPKGGNWEQAVDATAGQVMMQGGQPIKAWFSSTHGGYIHSSSDVGWSATSWTKSGVDSPSTINSFSDLQNNAYDKDSPWFYCDWGSRSSDNGTAWLQSGEVADIVNAILMAEKDSSTVNYLYQTDTPPSGTSPWSSDQLKQELQQRGVTPFSSVSNISVSVDFGSGNVNTVTVTGDAGTVSFSGSDFKNYFNLRAPSDIQIVGPLYNIEQR